MDLVMGIDAGTQALKAGIFDCKGNLVSESRSSYQSQTRYLFPYWETQDPQCWRESLIEAICKCVNQSGINPEKIKALGIDSTSSTLLMVDERGNPLEDALLWSDRRAVKQAEIVQEKLVSFGLHQGSGTAIPEMTLPKVLWLKENSPNYKKSFRIMEQGEWLIYQLTGEFTASRLTLIRFGNYLARIEGWPEGFLESLGLEDFRSKLPPRLEKPGTPVSELLSSVAKRIGLSNRTVVVEGGNDAYLALLGMGIRKEGQMGMILGSSIPYKIVLDKPIVAESFFGPFYDLLIPGKYFLGTSLAAGGTLLKWIKDNSPYNSLTGRDAYSVLENKASKIPLGSQGLFCFPFWNGVRSPVVSPLARGAFFGFDLSHTVESMYRAACEGIAYSIRHSIESLESSVALDEIFICGGNSESLLLTGILANVLNRPLHLAYPESSLLGSAICAAKGSGTYSSLEEAAGAMAKLKKTIGPKADACQKYDELFEQYKTRFKELVK